MQFVQEHQISQYLLERLWDRLNQSENFQPSQVYNSLTQEKLINTELRQSEFQTLTDPEIFDIAEEVINQINQDNQNKFYLHRNDIMYIKYQEGGYFKGHEDYLSLTSNLVEEYSMIICVTPKEKVCRGGETLLHLNKFLTHRSKASVTPGGCLLFRKDINHEGAVLESGQKEILTFNVWSMLEPIDEILMINFQNDDRKYLIPTNKIRLNHSNQKTLLEIFLESQYQKKKIGEKVINYNADCSYEEFSVIYKIYIGLPLNYNELNWYSHIIDFYLFSHDLLLVKTIAKSMSQKSSKSISDHVISENGDLILFGNQVRYIEFVETIKENRLPYIPFKLLLGEGILNYGGEMQGQDPTIIPMTPFCLTFSETDNIMLLYNPFSIEPDEPNLYNSVPFEEQLASNGEKWRKMFNNLLPNQEIQLLCNLEDEDENEDENEDEKDPAESKCLLYSTEEDQYSYNGNILHLNLACCGPFSAKNYGSNVVELLKIVTRARLEQISVKKSPCEENTDKFYSINDENKLTISPQHFNAIINKVNSDYNTKGIGQTSKHRMGFYEYIISQINEISFLLPQRTSESEEHFYCNENVYGNFNLLMIYGALKMESSVL